jgi:hypothetical protein
MLASGGNKITIGITDRRKKHPIIKNGTAKPNRLFNTDPIIGPNRRPSLFSNKYLNYYFLYAVIVSMIPSFF